MGNPRNYRVVQISASYALKLMKAGVIEDVSDNGLLVFDVFDQNLGYDRIGIREVIFGLIMERCSFDA